MRSASPLTRDLVLGGVLTAATQLELYLNQDRVSGPLAAQHLAFFLMTAPVGLRRAAPLAATLVGAGGLAIQTVAGDAPVVGGFLGMLVLLASLGYYADLRRGVIGLVAMFAAVVLYDVTAATLVVADLVGNVVIIGMAWAAGRLLRTAIDRRVAAEVSRDRFANEAVLAERARIARDLHDSVAHALTLMTLQAGAARERTDQPLVAEALETIENGGREALHDMHRFLQLLGDPANGGSDAPGVRDLGDLVERTLGVGLTVSLSIDDEVSALPASVSSTVYRIVQEGLTNAVKHAAASHVDVAVRRAGPDLLVSVEDDGAGRDVRRSAVPHGGRGLVGLQERVALFRGVLSTESTGTGWRLEATIPLDGTRNGTLDGVGQT